MNCLRVQNELSAYLDGELNGTEMIRVRQHLEQCPACAAEAEYFRQVKHLVQGLEACEPSADFEDALVAKVMGNASSSGQVLSLPVRKRSQMLGLSLTAAAAVVMAFVVFNLGRQQPKPGAPAPELTAEVRAYESMFVGSDPVSGSAPVFTVGSAPR